MLLCGIIAIKSIKNVETVARKSLDLLKHRGPDSQEGFSFNFENGSPLWTFIGHTRLRVVEDSVFGDQPMKSQSGRMIISFNGEIYNFRELAREFSIELRTDTDTELVIELIERIGLRAIQKFDGMFAFVILNLISGELTAARDRFGIKPLFLYSDKNITAISSELRVIKDLTKGLTPSDLTRRELEVMRGISPGCTVYEEVTELKPGSLWINGKEEKYFRLHVDDKEPPKDSELSELLVTTIQQASKAHASVGGFLSGGVDSAIVASISNVKRFWSAGTDLADEFVEAEDTAFRLGAKLQRIEVSSETVLEKAADMIRRSGVPIVVPNEILIDAICADASPHVKVMLSGEGADELFGGYDRVFRWASQARVFDIREFASLYCYVADPDLEIVERALDPFLGGRHPSLVVKDFFLQYHLHGLLSRLDRSTMGRSIEARPVFLGNDLVRLMAETGLRYQISQLGSKTQLRRVAKNFIPSDVSARPKIGFPVPLASVFSCTESEGYQRWSAWSWEQFLGAH